MEALQTSKADQKRNPKKAFEYQVQSNFGVYIVELQQKEIAITSLSSILSLD